MPTRGSPSCSGFGTNLPDVRSSGIPGDCQDHSECRTLSKKDKVNHDESGSSDGDQHMEWRKHIGLVSNVNRRVRPLEQLSGEDNI
ncbi:hypothetical protein TREES_T100004033 [Tupaia chinensis]|uniref:Uncharacterized protein n=1 Tax=Tupaia chinensis TaxID=246437 RepID=L9KMV7_TUPCH|nr:hypothetical protein TREES_T100004033 [Tupaia chinensis]